MTARAVGRLNKPQSTATSTFSAAAPTFPKQGDVPAASERNKPVARKPSFDFERRERQKAKDAKRAEKTKAKNEKKAAAAEGAPSEETAEPEPGAA